MNILHVTPYLAPAWAYGPVPRRVDELARAQAARGNQVTVLTTDATAPHERLHAGDSEVDGVRIVRLRNISGAVRTWLDLSTPAGMRRRARALFQTQRVDVVHLHELRTMENLLVLPTIPHGVPVVVSPHDTISSTGLSLAARAWDSLVLDRVVARATRLVVGSNTEADATSRLCTERGLRMREGLMAVVPVGLDQPPPLPRLSREAARRRFGLGDGPVVLFSGRVTHDAGLDQLVSAFADALPHTSLAQFLIVGGDHGGLGALREQLRSGGLETRVHIAGFLGPGDIGAAYAAADLLVIPAGGDTGRDAARQAKACGVPVLDGVGGLRALLTDAVQLAAAHDEAGRIAARHTWSAVAAAMDAVYESPGSVRLQPDLR